MSKITIELTDEQAAVFEKIGKQMRATPGEVILAAACGYVDMDRDNEAAEYSSILFDYVAERETPDQPGLWSWIETEEVSRE